MLELKILGACLKDRKCHELVNKHLDLKDIAPETQRVLKEIGKYYERDRNAVFADRDLILRSIEASIPDYQDKHREIFQELQRARANGRIPRLRSA